MNKTKKTLHTFKDLYFGEFIIFDSANAWWTDISKVQKLIDACKAFQTTKDICIYAGITRDQYNYFLEIHPDFNRVREIGLFAPRLRATNTVMSRLDDPVMARWFLKHTHPDFNPRLKEREEKSLENKDQEIDTSRIEEILSQKGDEFLELMDLRRQRENFIITKKIVAEALYITASGVNNLSKELIANTMKEMAFRITNSGLSEREMNTTGWYPLPR